MTMVPKEEEDPNTSILEVPDHLKSELTPKPVEISARTGKPKRRKAQRACTNCQRTHLTCDDDRPCERCIKRGCADTCVDGVRKRSRPTKGMRTGSGSISGEKPCDKGNGRHNSTPELAFNLDAAFLDSQASPRLGYNMDRPTPLHLAALTGNHNHSGSMHSHGMLGGTHSRPQSRSGHSRPSISSHKSGVGMHSNTSSPHAGSPHPSQISAQFRGVPPSAAGSVAGTSAAGHVPHKAHKHSLGQTGGHAPNQISPPGVPKGLGFAVQQQRAAAGPDGELLSLMNSTGTTGAPGDPTTPGSSSSAGNSSGLGLAGFKTLDHLTGFGMEPLPTGKLTLATPGRPGVPDQRYIEPPYEFPNEFTGEFTPDFLPDISGQLGSHMGSQHDLNISAAARAAAAATVQRSQRGGDGGLSGSLGGSLTGSASGSLNGSHSNSYTHLPLGYPTYGGSTYSSSYPAGVSEGYAGPHASQAFGRSDQGSGSGSGMRNLPPSAQIAALRAGHGGVAFEPYDRSRGLSVLSMDLGSDAIEPLGTAELNNPAELGTHANLGEDALGPAVLGFPDAIGMPPRVGSGTSEDAFLEPTPPSPVLMDEVYEPTATSSAGRMDEGAISAMLRARSDSTVSTHAAPPSRNRHMSMPGRAHEPSPSTASAPPVALEQTPSESAIDEFEGDLPLGAQRPRSSIGELVSGAPLSPDRAVAMHSSTDSPAGSHPGYHVDMTGSGHGSGHAQSVSTLSAASAAASFAAPHTIAAMPKSITGGAGVTADVFNTGQEVFRKVKEAFPYLEEFHAHYEVLLLKLTPAQMRVVGGIITKLVDKGLALSRALSKEDKVFVEQLLQRSLVEAKKHFSLPPQRSPTLGRASSVSSNTAPPGSSVRGSLSPDGSNGAIHSAPAVALWRRSGNIVAVSPQFTQLTKWTMDQLSSSFVSAIMENTSIVAHFKQLEELYATGQNEFVYPCTLVSATGELIPTRAEITIQLDLFQMPLIILGKFVPQ